VNANHSEPKVEIVIDNLYPMIEEIIKTMAITARRLKLFFFFFYLTEYVGDPIGFVFAAGSHDSFTVPMDIYR
jgi:hypothetical protein